MKNIVCELSLFSRTKLQPAGNSAATDPFDIDSSGARLESPFDEESKELPIDGSPRSRKSSDHSNSAHSVNSAGFDFTEIEGMLSLNTNYMTEKLS